MPGGYTRRHEIECAGCEEIPDIAIFGELGNDRSASQAFGKPLGNPPLDDGPPSVPG